MQQGSVPRMSHETDIEFLRQACKLASHCIPVASAYNVGAVLVDAAGVVIATGFSRELPGNTHAEEVAIHRAITLHSDAARGATLYTSMEPCGKRLSGKVPCVTHILKAGIARIVIAVKEPDVFVKDTTGLADLTAAGVIVDVIDDAESIKLAMAANDHVLSKAACLHEAKV